MILRDGNSAFLGSQSLRKLELEVRREVGIIFHDANVVRQLLRIFEKDWSIATPATDAGLTLLLESPAKKVAKVVSKRLDVQEKIEEMLEKVKDAGKEIPLEPEMVVESLRQAVREEVRNAVVHAVRELVSEAANPTGTGTIGGRTEI